MSKFWPLFCLLLLIVLEESNCKSGEFAAKKALDVETINGSSAIDSANSEVQFIPLRLQDSHPQPHSSCIENDFAPYPGDCRQYLHCLGGTYETYQCAPGLYWNNEKQICVRQRSAHCDTNDNSINQIDAPTAAIRPPVPVNSSTVPTSTSWPKKTTEATQLNRKPRSESRTTPLKPLSGYFKVVCYFTNFARYRKGAGRYSPGDVDPELCTHIVYGFAGLDPEKLIINANDFWADDDNGFQQRLAEFKSKGVKVSLALGGWGDSEGDKYSRLVNNPAARARFIKDALQFLEMYNFDGLDLEWEFPKCWRGDCTKGPDSDKQGFAAWVTELKQAFTPRGYLLSAAVSAIKTVVDFAYDVPVLGANLDWIAVRTFDFHGGWDMRTGHVAPLFHHPDDQVAFFNANFSVNYWISMGAPRRKIVMAMPLYGRSFQLEKDSVNGLNAKTTGLGQAGKFTVEAGLLAYYEICHNIKNEGWTVVQDPKKRMGPYAYKGNQWVSFDDKESIRLKSEYIRRMDLGGGMVWVLDYDDFRNRCGDGHHTLLSTIRNALAEKGTGRPEPFEPTDFETTIDGRLIVNRYSEFKVVCFFANWAWYRKGVGKYTPSNIDPNLCTHIIYGFAILNSEKLTMGSNDVWADFDNRFYEEMTAYKSRGIKVLVGLGGWQDSAGDKYSRLVNDPSARRRFISQAVNYIETNNFDGLTIEWIHPKCWLTNCSKGPASDKPAFASFVKELREAFEPKGWLLSVIVPHNRRAINAGYDIPVLSRYLDWLIVKCYDYHGPWDNVTGHVAPMYVHPEDGDAAFNTNSTIQYYLEKGADRKKLVLGMPMYGQSFTLADSNVNELNAPARGDGEAGDISLTRGTLTYYEICSNIIKKGWKVVRDEKYRTGPYAYLGNQWVSFDDVDMIRHKSEYIKAMGLGGGMIWSLDMDDFKNICHCEEYPLLRTINRVLRDYAKPDPSCVLGCDESVTHLHGKSTICKGSVIFEDQFNQDKIDTRKWLIEEYIPFNDPNYEFVSYQNDEDVCFIRNKNLFIKPKADAEEKNVLDLRKSCTRVAPEECYTEKDTFIVPPVVSAKLVCKVKFRYGEIEIKAKLPAGDWIFPKIYLGSLSNPNHTMWIAYARGNDRLLSSHGAEDLGNRLLLGGPVLYTGEPGRSKYLKSKRFQQPVSNDFHVYKLRWTQEKIILSVDGVPFGEIDEATMRNIKFAQTDTVHLVLGVGVGGINDFPDGVTSTNNEPKPWTNFSPHNRNQFFQARNKWLTTWRGDHRALQVDYVKITAL